MPRLLFSRLCGDFNVGNFSVPFREGLCSESGSVRRVSVGAAVRGIIQRGHLLI